MCSQEQDEKLSLGFHMLIVQDVDRALRFYSDVLGLEVHSFDQENNTPEWARLIIDDTTIVLRINEYDDYDGSISTAVDLVRESGPDGLRWSGLYFDAYDIPQLCLRVNEAGGRTLNPPRRARGGTIVADVADTEGNVFILYSN